MKKWYAIYSNILYMHFSEKFLQIPESAKNTYSPTNTLLRLLRIVGYSLLRLIGNIFKKEENPQALKDKVWLYVVSQNNYDSLKFLKTDLADAVFVAGQSKSLGKYKSVVERISLRSKIAYYYKFLPLFYEFLKHNRKSSLRFFDILYDSIGFYEIYRRKLLKYQPKAVVFANDHNPDARALLLAAKSLGIKTIYIQHASISDMFPPLSFDLNLLEGQDSLDKYRKCGPVEGRVELVGMPKADKFTFLRNNKKEISKIGIGCNLLDELSEIKKLLQHISECLPQLRIILRPHPRDTRNFKAFLNISQKITLSDSRSIATFDYLQEIDVQISGNSGIHLEAVLLNVWSIYYDFNIKDKLEDYYGFVKHNLIDFANTPEELQMLLLNHLHNKPDVVERAKYYNATICTPYEGQSIQLALKYIVDFMKY